MINLVSNISKDNRSRLLLKRYISLLIFLVILNISAFSQPYIKGIIVEKSSKLPIAFASVTYQKESLPRGVISDIHGKFVITDRDIKGLQVSCVGYQKQNVTITPDMRLSELVVELKTDTLNIGEVTITPAMNPAVRIMREVLKNKKINDFENYDKYTYQCYLKTILNLKLSYNATAEDSATIRKNKDLNKHASFISESMILSSTVEPEN